MAKTHIQTKINGDDIDVLVEPGQSLLDVLRDELDMTGTKEAHFPPSNPLSKDYKTNQIKADYESWSP